MNILDEKAAFQRLVSRHLVTTGGSQLSGKLTFWKASQRGWKEIESPLSSLKLISLCTLQVVNNKYFIVKDSLDFCYF